MCDFDRVASQFVANVQERREVKEKVRYVW